MKKIDPRHQACTGKRVYVTQAEAQVTIDRMRSQGHRALQTYKCAYCENYHIGHAPGSSRWRRR